MLSKTSIIIPAYNEALSVASVIQKIYASGFQRIIVVDDASTDNTAAVAEAAGALVLRLPVNMGAWHCSQTGLRFAFERGDEIVVTVDADGQHPPASIASLIKPLEARGANFSIGSNPERGSILRKMAWKSLGLVSGLRIADLTSGFRAYDLKALKVLSSEAASASDYQDLGILLLLQHNDLQPAIVPVTMERRLHGASRIFYSWLAVFRYLTSTVFLGICKRRIGLSAEHER